MIDFLEGVIEEIKEAGLAFGVLGVKVYDVIYGELPFSREKRNLVILEKVSFTPQHYPRRSGVPSRRPLLKG